MTRKLLSAFQAPDRGSVAAARPDPLAPASAYEWSWLERHTREERRSAELLGEIRETVFGAQDGLVSTLAVIATVAGASADAFAIVVAGIASALAGIFSMSAGEYIGSKSQREIFDAQIRRERGEVAERPGEAEAEVAYMLAEEGLDESSARDVATILARHPDALLRTMVSKELGLQVEGEGGSPLQGAMFMGVAFGLASIVPIIAFVAGWALGYGPTGGLVVSLIATGAVLFGIGVLKSRWTGRNPLASGLEILALATFAGVAGFAFGTLLPAALGAAGLVAG